MQTKHKLEDYITDWILVEKYIRLYDRIIHPSPYPCMWGETNFPSLDHNHIFELRKKERPEKHESRESISVIWP